MSDFTNNLNRLNQKMAKVAMEKQQTGISKQAYMNAMSRYLVKCAQNAPTAGTYALTNNSMDSDTRNTDVRPQGIWNWLTNKQPVATATTPVTKATPQSRMKIKDALMQKRQKYSDWNNQRWLSRMWQGWKMRNNKDNNIDLQ